MLETLIHTWLLIAARQVRCWSGLVAFGEAQQRSGVWNHPGLYSQPWPNKQRITLKTDKINKKKKSKWLSNIIGKKKSVYGLWLSPKFATMMASPAFLPSPSGLLSLSAFLLSFLCFPSHWVIWSQQLATLLVSKKSKIRMGETRMTIQ